MTKYADRILSIINMSRKHPTAVEIHTALKEEEPKVVLATVYNNLHQLLKEGKIRKVIVDGQSDRYDRIEKHDHLVCRKCGEISDVYLDDLTKSLEDQIPEQVLSYDLQISYVCPACREH